MSPIKIGNWIAIAVAVLVVLAVARYIFIERPKDRRRHG